MKCIYQISSSVFLSDEIERINQEIIQDLIPQKPCQIIIDICDHKELDPVSLALIIRAYSHLSKLKIKLLITSINPDIKIFAKKLGIEFLLK